MAYPAFGAAPFVYAANFRAQEVRVHGSPNRVRFGASSDVNAATVAAYYAALNNGNAIQTSLVKRRGQHNLHAVHPTGTALSCRILLVDASGAAWRLLLRNLASNATVANISQMFVSSTVTGATITPPAAPATLPNSGNAVAEVQVSIINKA